MKPHKRSGRDAKKRRVEKANARHEKIEKIFGYSNPALKREFPSTPRPVSRRSVR